MPQNSSCRKGKKLVSIVYSVVVAAANAVVVLGVSGCVCAQLRERERMMISCTSAQYQF